MLQLDEEDRIGIERYLLEQKLADQSDLPCAVEPAGSGNMNLTLRVTLGERRLILKQGRPWVEKYDHIEAPWERTLIEGLFYAAVRGEHAVSGRMPELLRLDERHHVLVLSDEGRAGDFTSIYSRGEISSASVAELLDWLSALGKVRVAEPERTGLANRAMRALNYEHIFRLPLARDNGLDLDRVTEGLTRAAEDLKSDDVYRARVLERGSAYLSDGLCLVHGDYFPGSWLSGADGLRIIDPEFCFLGAREFDYGVMIAHLALARTGVDLAEGVLAATRREQLDLALMLNFAGIEIMRRLIGVAQLPLPHDLNSKRRLLEVSRSLVLTPEQGLSCW